MIKWIGISDVEWMMRELFKLLSPTNNNILLENKWLNLAVSVKFASEYSFMYYKNIQWCFSSAKVVLKILKVSKLYCVVYSPDVPGDFSMYHQRKPPLLFQIFQKAYHCQLLEILLGAISLSPHFMMEIVICCGCQSRFICRIYAQK